MDVMQNKLLLGAGLAIIGFLLVLFAPKPVNTVGLVVFIAGLAVTAYGAYTQFVANRPESVTAATST